MVGCLYFKVYYNLDVLKEKIEKNGWSLKDISPSKEEVEKKDKLYKEEYGERGGMFNHDIEEGLYILSKEHEGGTYRTTLPLTLVIVMLSSMYTSNFLIDGLSALLDEATKNKFKLRNITINFLGEKKVLI